MLGVLIFIPNYRGLFIDCNDQISNLRPLYNFVNKLGEEKMAFREHFGKLLCSKFENAHVYAPNIQGRKKFSVSTEI